MVLDVDEERRRISLGIKQCRPIRGKSSPRTTTRATRWSARSSRSPTSASSSAWPGGIDGLVHLSDMSWDMPGEEVVRNYKKGERLEAVVLAIDPERERISLGIKQLAQDPFSGYLADIPKGSIVRASSPKWMRAAR
jgi:small subunit ribosomal protein S1